MFFSEIWELMSAGIRGNTALSGNVYSHDAWFP